MSWLSLILTLAKIVGQIAQYLHDKNLIDAGGAAAVVNVLKGQADDLQSKLDAMAAAGKRFDTAAGGGKLPDDIGLRD